MLRNPLHGPHIDDRLHSIPGVSSTTNLNELIQSKNERDRELIVKKSCAANWNKPLSTPYRGENTDHERSNQGFFHYVTKRATDSTLLFNHGRFLTSV